MDFERWKRLMNALGFGVCEETFGALLKAYSEKHRYYHTDEHINAVLRHLDEVEVASHKIAEIELALWFHDAIYKPFSNTNELDSANWASEFLTSNNAPLEIITNVHKLIMSTVHTGMCDDEDEALMVDIDLTILGASETTYEMFEQAIRKEYKRVPAVIYTKKRSDILRGFLERVRIYQNDYFHDKYEAQARKNMRQAVAMLSAR